MLLTLWRWATPSAARPRRRHGRLEARAAPCKVRSARTGPSGVSAVYSTVRPRRRKSPVGTRLRACSRPSRSFSLSRLGRRACAPCRFGATRDRTGCSSIKVVCATYVLFSLITTVAEPVHHVPQADQLLRRSYTTGAGCASTAPRAHSKPQDDDDLQHAALQPV